MPYSAIISVAHRAAVGVDNYPDRRVASPAMLLSAGHRWRSDKRLCARRCRREPILVMQACQDRSSMRESSRSQSMQPIDVRILTSVSVRVAAEDLGHQYPGRCAVSPPSHIPRLDAELIAPGHACFPITPVTETGLEQLRPTASGKSRQRHRRSGVGRARSMYGSYCSPETGHPAEFGD